MGYIQNFAKAVSLSGKKKGRRPVMNAQQFYPRGLERELQQKTEAEFERILRELTEVALVGYSGNFEDDIVDLMSNPLDFSEEFKNAVDNIMKRTDVHAHANFSRQAELIIGAPYYPPGTAEGILNDWKSTFLSYCKSAGEQQKTKIATIVLEGKEKGWNKAQLEKEIMSKLDPQFQNRAELIARTELGKLNSRITLETYKSVGVEYYKWLTTIDGRERESHAELNDVICSVSDPDVYFEENEKNPLSPIQKMRTATMYHGHPGTDFQCRCSMVMWDPEIDGQYKVKESDYEERKAAEEAEKLAQEQAEAERIAQEQAEKEKAARELKEAKRLAEEAKKALEEAKKARIEAAAVKRHAERDAYEIQKAWDERKAARAAAIKESQDIINQYGGITEFPTDEIKNYLANDQTKKALEAAKKLKSDVDAEVSKLNLLEDPLAVLKQWGAKNSEGVQKAVETKLASWDSMPLQYKKKKLEFEIDWLEKTKKYNTWKVSQDAYSKQLNEVKNEIAAKEVWDDCQKFLNESSLGNYNNKALKAHVKEISSKLQLGFADFKNDQSLISYLKKKLIAANKQLDKLKIQAANKLNVSKCGNGVASASDTYAPVNFAESTEKQRSIAFRDKSQWKTIDKELFNDASNAWTNASDPEKIAAYGYTVGSKRFNEPLYGAKYSGNYDIAKTLTEDIPNLTKIIDRTSLVHDAWIRSGQGSGTLNGVFGTDLLGEFNALKKTGLSPQDAASTLTARYSGLKGTQEAFTSTAFSYDTGFVNMEVNFKIFAPKGSKILYAEPFSNYGHRDTSWSTWNGTDPTVKLGALEEFEGIVQRGTEYRLIEFVYDPSSSQSSLTAVMEIVKQEPKPYLPTNPVTYQ